MARMIAAVVVVLYAVRMAEAVFLDKQLEAACQGKNAEEAGTPIKNVDVARDGQVAPVFVAPVKADYDVLCLKQGSLQKTVKGRMSKCKLQDIVDVDSKKPIEVTLPKDADDVRTFKMLSNHKAGNIGKLLSCEFHCGTTTAATIDDCTLVK